MTKLYKILIAAVLSCVIAVSPVAAQDKGKDKGKDGKKPVEIVREPKPDSGRGGSNQGRGGNDRGGKQGKDKDKPPPPNDLFDV